ncbi:MAG TPA: hypothetical protein VM450_17550 [Thermomicrobiales bacterium]|nr:hypothetical protein [Thermomicrobiales bacterium]
MHPHLYELDYVNAVIAQNHHAARRAEQRRSLRDDGLNGRAAMIARMRAAVISMLAGPGGTMDPARAPDPEPEPNRG